MVKKRHLSSQESHEEQPILRRRGLVSLARTVSPPLAHAHGKNYQKSLTPDKSRSQSQKSKSAAIEAGEDHVVDHVAFYAAHLLSAIRPILPSTPRIGHQEWLQLYKRNAGSLKGCHFIVHQHDHPIAGTHYDLRLQCNPTSSISFAIMYGLPGDPNSRRLNRNATETRVHCLWNHLIETASHSTGSMLIWDTGEFEILPYEEKGFSGTTTEEDTDSEDNDAEGRESGVTEQEKLRHAFGRRKVKLRLHGTRLPTNYTLSLRLTKGNDRHEQPTKPSRRRRRPAPATTTVLDSSDSDTAIDARDNHGLVERGGLAEASDPQITAAIASDDENETIRANNAYTGALNDIGSIHQRRWYLSIDRKASGFEKQTSKSASGFIDTIWARKRIVSPAGADDEPTGFDRFIVGGRDTERSIVTGRLAGEILADEGVMGYIPRGLWKPITI